MQLMRTRIKREYPRRIVMPNASKGFSAEVTDLVTGTVRRDVTEVLLGVLRSIEPYEACIVEAERDGDLEVATFLRELRRQDIVRAREATRLLKRSLGRANVVEMGGAHAELSVGS
jgi:hypothetical protein